jgi:chemotaxis protein MotB
MDIFDFENEHEEKPQHANELWLVTFSDLLSLLLACFVMMMAVSSVNKGKFDEVAGALTESLNVPGQNAASSPSKVTDIKVQIEDMLKSEGLKDARIQSTDKGLAIVLNESILFSSGGAQIQGGPSADVIRNIGRQLAQLPNYKKITVEGHTDDLPIHSANFRSNWELSAARALSVLELLQTAGIPGSKLNFQGFGEFDPEVPNVDENNNPNPENRRKNRRVVIRIN